MHTHMHLVVYVHDNCVHEEAGLGGWGGHRDSRTRMLLVSMRHRSKGNWLHNLRCLFGFWLVERGASSDASGLKSESD